MANPEGTVRNRWNQVVSRVAADQGWTSAQADEWMNRVWLTMWEGDEVAGVVEAHEKLLRFLEANYPDASTLPRAFTLMVT